MKLILRWNGDNMRNLEIMPTEENLLEAIKENILKRNDALVYFYKLICFYNRSCKKGAVC